MINIKLEIFLGNTCFVLLFLNMVIYWVQAIFSIIPKFNLVIFITTFCANLSLVVLLTLRWVNYNHFPLSNLYESLIFLSWSFTCIQLLLVPIIFKLNLTKINTTLSLVSETSGNKTHDTLNQYTSWYLLFLKNFLPNRYVSFYDDNENFFTSINIILGTIISPIALFTNSFATFSLPKTMQKAQALVPALQSNWLMMHVTVMMLSYTALLCGSLLAITFLIVTWFEKFTTNKPSILLRKPSILENFRESLITEKSTNVGCCNNDVYFSQDKNSYGLTFTNVNEKLHTKQPLTTTISHINQQSGLPINTLTQTLDNLSYRILGIGFPLLTIGILSGAVWANQAWGSYWSWDPKETWAFITWLVFAMYLHVRIVKGWQGKKPAILASVGFFIVWICYLGVNLLGTGLHSYGWMQ